MPLELPLSAFSKLSNRSLSEAREARKEEGGSAIDILIGRCLSQPLVLHEVDHYSKTLGLLNFKSRKNLRRLVVPTAKTKKASRDHVHVIGSDLSEGKEQYRRPPPSDIYRLDDLLAAVDDAGIDAGVLSLRRNLLMLALIPLNAATALHFNILRCGAYTVVDFDHTVDDLAAGVAALGAASEMDHLCYTGVRFERVATATPDEESLFYTVVSHSVNGRPVVLTAEIDAATDGEGLALYVELKTHTLPKSHAQLDYKLTRKLLASWCQMRLVGGRHLVVGFRKAQQSQVGYRLAAVKVYKANEIPDLINTAGHAVLASPQDPHSTVTCQKLLRWYQLVVGWIASETPDANAAYSLQYDPAARALRLRQMDPVTAAATRNDRIAHWFLQKHCT